MATAVAGVHKAVAFTTNAVDTAAAAADLALNLVLAGTPAMEATASGAIAQSTPLAANALASATGAAAVNQAVSMMASAISVSNLGSADLALSKPLAAPATATVGLQSEAAVSILLSATPQSSAAQAAALAINKAMASAALATSGAPTALHLAVPLAGISRAVAATTVALALDIRIGTSTQARVSLTSLLRLLTSAPSDWLVSLLQEYNLAGVPPPDASTAYVPIDLAENA